MIDYRVRSVSLLNLVNDIRSKKLIPDAYFQRNLVWRETHKVDFIDTILSGYPFPQIFISKGKIDVDRMITVSCIVDGQQRTNAIMEFIDDKFPVRNKYFNELDGDEKANFLKYEIAVIELDLENDDPKVNDIFQRINRTSNSLTIIEKLASQYSTSDYMLVAKLLTDQIDVSWMEDEEAQFKEDPNIPVEFYSWAKTKEVNNFRKLILEKGIYTSRDLSRKVHLIHILNIMSTYLYSFFNRNDKTYDYLNSYSYVFEEKDDLIDNFEKTASIILKMKFTSKSYWLNKANFFTLFLSIVGNVRNKNIINVSLLKEKLNYFSDNLPDDYKLAASEAVNNKKERQLRAVYIDKIVSECISCQL
ncbi:DUF262 domain-containing protein [Photorhabdus aegyptia]|uniref:GmrSD restriction endonucleases N-terminal domain-containing protein n=1 Tax=Photorhabdus aegyptia TaxID=2805098 RepID=A0A022PPI8_9GAMM|nr:DUF262 domain-containing protein [Photorhabdus aegyptia]EYU16803.1 Protein of unknown function DUF262 [Photorhabdus aegyptia]